MVQAPDSGSGMTLLYLIDNGALVKEGDIVARIDPQVVTDHLEDVEANVKQNEMELRGLRASLDAENEVMLQRIAPPRAHGTRPNRTCWLSTSAAASTRKGSSSR